MTTVPAVTDRAVERWATAARGGAGVVTVSSDSEGTTFEATGEGVTVPASATVEDPAAGRARRLATGALGGALVVLGIRRRGLVGSVAALAGGALVYRALGGHGRKPVSGGPTGGSDRASDSHPPEATASVSIQESPSDLSERLRDPETLQQVLGDAVSVTEAGADRQRWTVHGPKGREASWEMRLEVSDERLRWRPVDDSALFEEWALEFESAPGDRGTRVTLRVRFDPPGGRLGRDALDRLDVVPETFAATALDRLKSLVETGEIPTLGRNISARGRGDLV